MTAQRKISRRIAACLSVALAAACASAALPGPEDDRSTPAPGTTFGVSRPSQELKLAFPLPGVISDVLVKQGDVVKKDQVLANQDNQQDTITLASDEAEVLSTDEIEYSKADLAQKVIERDQKKTMYDQRVATKTEWQEAELAVQLSDARVKLAVVEHQKKVFERDKQKDKLEKEKLKSPINGVVKKLNIGPGEMADPQNREGSIVVAQWDPMWLEANPPTAEAKNLQLGQVLDVTFEGEKKPRQATIVFLDQYDFGSESRLVRLEMKNPTLQPPGLRVTITLPPAGR
jgi:multidrug efflux pump subunit AcrA (membrane-fusion protein)